MVVNKLNAVNYQNVKLSGRLFNRQFTGTLEYYLAIPDDDLLYGFRKRAGLAAPGHLLNGWYGGGVFHVFGQILGALAKFYGATGDPRLSDKVRRLLDGWAACMEVDGYNLQNPKGRANDPHYEYEKLTGGLVDCIEYLGSDMAVDSLSKLTDWAMNELNTAITLKKKDEVYSSEWYTLSENLYRAYQATGEEKYLNFARIWEYPYYWDKYLEPETFSSSPKHAYSHINTLNGAAMAYRCTGELRYLEIIKNAYEYITSKFLYATGGYGPCEKLFGEPGYLGESVMHTQDAGWGHTEVSCCTWAVFKLCRYLMEFTGEAVYADWVEKMLYNCIGAELLPKPGGRIMYYANYYLNGAYKNCDDGRMINGNTFEWPCCSGTLPQAIAEYGNLIYFMKESCLNISQYIPSSLRWNANDVNVCVRIDTSYPEEENIKILVDTDRPVGFTLKMRMPAWANEASMSVNGQQVPVDSSSGNWILLQRIWTTGDVVKLQFPMKLRFLPVDEMHPDIVALCHGPVVLVSDISGLMMGDSSNPDAWIKPCGEFPLHFATEPGNLKVYPERQKLFKPFYESAESEIYFLYNRIEVL